MSRKWVGKRTRSKQAGQQQAKLGATIKADKAVGKIVDIHEMNVSEAREFVEVLTTIETLTLYWENEKRNPSYEGGRVGVIEAIEARIAELEADARNA